ncbi:MAG: hypothetical protein NT117_00170 [Gammaproteobacteria bacterium]|nr:hypothetical protein [Gammaproteobacteria bacterium]
MSLSFATSQLRMIRGLTWADQVQLVNKTTLVPIDLTGVVGATMRIRLRRNTATALLELSTTNGRLTIEPGTDGLITVDVSAEDTLELPINNHKKARYVYDVVLDRGGDPQVLEPATGGKVTVNPQTTRLLPEPA